MFDRTRKELSNLLWLLQRMLDVFSIIVFVVFTLFYGYQIYAHIFEGVAIIIIYALLLVLHTVMFIFAKTTKIEGETHAERYEQRRIVRKRKRIFKIGKFSVNGAAIIWNVVEIFTKDVSDLRIMIVIISAVFLFAQILLEVILNLMIIYFDNLRIAAIEDVREIDFDSNFVTKFLSKSLGIKKIVGAIQDEDYLSETEKEIAQKRRIKE